MEKGLSSSRKRIFLRFFRNTRSEIFLESKMLSFVVLALALR
jgi:hypothetical protein